MKKILVPCDFSRPAINAFRFALKVASEAKGVIHLLYVIELPVIYDPLLMPILSFEEEYMKDLKKKAEKKFNEMVMKYNTEGIEIEPHIAFGPTVKMIDDYARDSSIDLIVMGSHGADGLKEFVIGSNAEKVVRSSPVPVLIVKENSNQSVKNIIFPNTLETDNQEELVTRIKALQHFFKAKLHIVWINTPVNFTSDSVTVERLKSFAKRFMLKDYSINVFNHSNEEDGILHFARIVGGDMIAMATHGRKGILHVLNGSLAEDVANHATCLIWTWSLKNSFVEADNGQVI
jgi:nucleotide-binding universal stress UspA family protein